MVAEDCWRVDFSLPDYFLEGGGVGLYYPLGTISTVPRAHNILRPVAFLRPTLLQDTK
jgi:hypothetical protein